MPTLNWIGKEAVVRHHKDVPYRLLEPVPDLSCGDPNSGNLIVQGDNLHALKALLPRYAGKVKCIYIDPPYNTGNEGWVYNDNVNSPEIRKWLGEVVGKEAEDLSRHDKWLCMMYPRLALLRRFLRDDGVLFVSIDDNEVHHLRSVADQIDGLSFAGAIVWERKRKGSHLSKRLTKKTEYILIFSPSPAAVELVGEDVGDDEDFPLVKRTNAVKELRIPCDRMGPTSLADGLYPAGPYGRGGTAVVLLEDLEVSDHRFTRDVHIRGPFVWTQENLDQEIAQGARFFLRTKNMSLRAVKGSSNQGQKGLSSLLTKAVGTNEDASAELAEMLGVDLNSVFQYSKPTGLIKLLIRAATYADKQAIVLDSFAGSGTTGHAVLKQNFEDGGKRRFVLVELEAAIAASVTAKRLQRAVTGYKNASDLRIDGLGSGFDFCQLSADPLFDADGRIRAEIGFHQLAEFVWFLETGSGFAGATDGPLLGQHEGRAIYLLYNGILKDRSINGGNVLTGPVYEGLPQPEARSQKPEARSQKIIYAAACRLGKARLARENIIFKQTPYALDF